MHCREVGYYPSAEMQSAYSIAPVNWAEKKEKEKRVIFNNSMYKVVTKYHLNLPF